MKTETQVEVDAGRVRKLQRGLREECGQLPVIMHTSCMHDFVYHMKYSTTCKTGNPSSMN